GKGSGEGRANRPRSRHCDRPKAVSQGTLPCRGDCAFREKRRSRKPHRDSLWGFLVCNAPNFTAGLLKGDSGPRARFFPSPSLETVASIHPDLVLVTKSLNRIETVQALQDLGIPSYATDPQTILAILSSIQRLADVLGAPETGSALARDLQRQLTEIQQRVT